MKGLPPTVKPPVGAVPSRVPVGSTPKTSPRFPGTVLPHGQTVLPPVNDGIVRGAKWFFDEDQQTLRIKLTHPRPGEDAEIPLRVRIRNRGDYALLPGLAHQVAELHRERKYTPRFKHARYTITAPEWHAILEEAYTGIAGPSVSAFGHPRREPLGEGMQENNHYEIFRRVAGGRFELVLVQNAARPDAQISSPRLEITLASEPSHEQARLISLGVWLLYDPAKPSQLPVRTQPHGTLTIIARDKQGRLLFDENNPPAPTQAVSLLASLLQKRHGLNLIPSSVMQAENMSVPIVPNLKNSVRMV